MKLLFFILNQEEEQLEGLLLALGEIGIKGATVIPSTGMARVLGNIEMDSFLGPFRMFLNPDREENKTIMMVVRDEQLEAIRECIHEKVGDLSLPNTGILFTVPIDFVEGINF